MASREGSSQVGTTAAGRDPTEIAQLVHSLRLVPVAGALWLAQLAVFQLWGRGHGGIHLVLLVLLLISLVVFVGKCRGSPGGSVMVGILLAVGFAAIGGSLLAGLRLAPLIDEQVADLGRSHSAATVTVRLSEKPRVVTGGQVAPLWAAESGDQSWRTRGILLRVEETHTALEMAVPIDLYGTSDSAEREGLIAGTTVQARVSIREGEPVRGTALSLRVRGSPTVVTPAAAWQYGAEGVRASMRAAAQATSSDSSGLLPGLVVGDESRLSETLGENMRVAGLAHLTAVSGSNVSIVLAAVLGLGALFRVPRSLNVGCAALAMVAFVGVVGPQPSVLRAAAMGSVALLSLLTRRPSSGVTGLAVCVVLVLLVDPWMAVSVGFGLSVSATAGIVWLTTFLLRRPKLARPLLSIRSEVISDPLRAGSGFPGLARVAIAWPLVRARAAEACYLAFGIAAMAQICTLPLIASFGDGLPVASAVANMLAAPAVPIATIVGGLAALIGLLAPDLAALVVQPAGWAAQWIASVAAWCADLPFATVSWFGGWLGAVTAAALSVSMLVIWRQWRHVCGWLLANRRAALLTVAVTVGVWFIVRQSATPWPPPNWQVLACDVGQGDAVAIASGEGHAIVVDAGPAPGPVDECLSEAGVHTVDLLVLTHFHADHVDGLPGVIADRTVGDVMVSPLPEPQQQVSDVTAQLGSRGVPMRAAKIGERAVIGAVEYEVVGPSRLMRAAGSAPNNASVTLVVTIGPQRLTMLLTGDLEPPAQATLLAEQPQRSFDVVKIPHHGSRNQAANVANGFPATAAIISVGATNTYGHPAPETIARWESSGATVLRTDQQGAVAITKQPTGELTVATSR